MIVTPRSFNQVSEATEERPEVTHCLRFLVGILFAFVSCQPVKRDVSHRMHYSTADIKQSSPVGIARFG
jgi:hypothetical protein